MQVGRQKLRFSTNIWLHRVLSTMRPRTVIHTAAPDRGKVVTLIAGKRCHICSQETDDEVFTTRLNVTPKTTEQNLIVHIDKSEATIINNKRLRSKKVLYC